MADEPEPEVIRQQMEAQRASLAEKLETLENKIVQTVEGAREAVAETVQTVKESVQSSVETVKDTVQSSVDTVKETFDLPLQVQRHPWAMFGGSVALGFAAGLLINRAAGTSRSTSRPWGALSSFTRGSSASYTPPSEGSHFRDEPRPATSFTGAPMPGGGRSESPAGGGQSWMDELSQTFGPEVQKLKGLAIGAAMGLVRDMVSQSVPDQLRPRVAEVMDGITAKLGGEPVQGQLLDELLPQRASHHNGHHGERRHEEVQA